MIALRNFWQNLGVRSDEPVVAETPAKTEVTEFDMDIAPNDALLTYFQQRPGVVDISELKLSSPALKKLQAAGVMLVIPLMSQGDLIGMINLGQRLSDQIYSSEDRKLLSDLAVQAAPALRVAQLVRQQQLEALERGRMEQELRVAAIIQQTLLPHSVPQIAGWEVAAYYKPAREVGGDFYEFLYLEDCRIAFVIGDVTDKGVPAAMVMTTTRTLLRAVP
jgi:hypothetical protein